MTVVDLTGAVSDSSGLLHPPGEETGLSANRAPSAGSVFRIALYAADGTLLKASEAFPVEHPPNPQTVADLSARAADTGCTYEAGTVLVWTDHATQPHQRIEQTPKADGRRSFGGQHPPVPTYHWRRRPDSSIQLVPAQS